MSSHLADSEIYGHLWTTPELHALFDDHGRTSAWLTILAALAQAQADVGLVPAEAADADRRARDDRPAGPRRGRRGHPLLRALDARADQPPPGDPAGGGARVGLLRRDRAGPLRHVVRLGPEARRRHRRTGRRPLPRRVCGARPAPPRHRDVRPHPRPARACRSRSASRPPCGRRSWPPPGAAGAAAAARGGGPARRGAGHDGVLGRAGVAVAGRVRRAARPGRAGRPVDHRARPRRRVPDVPGARHGHAGQDRQRGLRAAAAGDRRARRADRRGHGRQHHDAAQAQPGVLRAARHAGPASCAPTPTSRWRGWSPCTSGTAGAGRPSGSCCPRPASSPARRWGSARSCWKGCGSTPRGCAPTSTRTAPR